MQDSSSVLIETQQLYKIFGNVVALENINLQIKQGEFVAIMGSSGSGKTTLMNILTCLDAPSKGKVLWQGVDFASFTENEKQQFRAEKIGLVFQQFHLIPYLTALENVMLAQYYHSVTDKESAMKVLDQVKLSHRYQHLPSQLSGGEQQRVCIARSLVNQPSVIFADEPTGNLDEENEKFVLTLLLEQQQAGKTVVMITHNPELAELADRTLQFQHGRYLGDRS